MDRLIVKKRNTDISEVPITVINILDREGNKCNIPMLTITDGPLKSSFDNAIDFLASDKNKMFSGAISVRNDLNSGIIIIRRVCSPNYSCVLILSDKDCAMVYNSFIECEHLYCGNLELPSIGKVYSKNEIQEIFSKKEIKEELFGN